MTITAELVTLFITVFGALAGVWWRVESKINIARKEAIDVANSAARRADEAAKGLADHKLFAAENFVTKAGMTEAVNRINEAINRLTDRIDVLIRENSGSSHG